MGNSYLNNRSRRPYPNIRPYPRVGLLGTQRDFDSVLYGYSSVGNPSRSREVILQDLARFLQKRVILQDLARWRLSCKILQDGAYLARILKESCKITIPKFLSKNTKKITEIRCKIKKIVSRTRIQNFK